MRKNWAFIALVLSFALIAGPLNAAGAKAGAKCTTAGATSTVGGKKFTCVKSGKKLVWNKGVAVKAAAKPAINPVLKPAEPTPTPVATPTKTADPIVYFSANEASLNANCLIENEIVASTVGPLICDKFWILLRKENDTVASRANRIVFDRYVNQGDSKLSIRWVIDPKAPDWKNRIQKGMSAGARFWGTSSLDSPIITAYVSDDKDFQISERTKDGIILRPEELERIKNGTCSAGWHSADNQNVKTAYWDFTFTRKECLNDVGFYQVPAHEYTHYAQDFLTGGKYEVNRVPWLHEGLAAFIGAALGPQSDMGNDLRNQWAKQVRNLSADLKFFSNDSPTIYSDPRWGTVYPQGAIANEALMVLVGVEGIESLYKFSGQKGLSIDKIFQNVVGLNVSQTTALLQGYVDSVERGSPWGISELLQKYAEARR